MDHFGIGSAIRGAVEIYLRSARGTGRTTSMLDSLKDGDVIVCSSSREANRLNVLCQERSLSVKIRTVDPKKPELVFQYGTPPGEARTILDHTWVEEYYLNAIDRARKEIDELQRESSGYGEAHRKTKRAAEEAYRWH